ncbi:cobyric acid synthase [Martelella alba]|uniref:Cobyric acid synthase n=1 Tax=Martelella alba TaxID=2590451 RepID=A0ABY2SRI2_9HYPH|nr:cobyric acid synthase [Martelella alba]TKI08030.1 cobyric acid synthase [Martelella alba]
MALSIMLQGTASDVGKSVLAAGLCRIFAQDGYRVAPFKAQNMALNSWITRDGAEMGRAQVFQAEAAGIEPDVRMNPILLKPTSDQQAQVIVMGEALCHMGAADYHHYKPQLRRRIGDIYRSLAAQYDIMVLEGAGSPAEINLRDRDLVNMGMARQAEAPVLLVADIDKGGVFAAIYGTLALLQPDEKARVKGVIINKFRGDPALLQPGIAQIESLTGVPVVGVMPWFDEPLEDEDGVALQGDKYRRDAGRELDAAVIQLPHIANFSDFNALAVQPDVRLRYVKCGTSVGVPDLLILPGSKNTLGDLLYLREHGIDQEILAAHERGVPIIGICGGFQMLGRKVVDGVESGIEAAAGLGLLDCETRFAPLKTTTQVTAQVMALPHGVFAAGAGQDLFGYEIHMGHTALGAGARPFARLARQNGQDLQQDDGAVNERGDVAGSYIHGLFDSPSFTRTLLDALRERRGLGPLGEAPAGWRERKQQSFDALARQMRAHIDIERIYRIMAASAALEEHS